MKDSQGLYEMEEIVSHGITHFLKIRQVFTPEKGKKPLGLLCFLVPVTWAPTLRPSLFFGTGHLGYHP
jgi:hypothetical protein